MPFETTVGSATVDPSSIDVTTPGDTGGFDVTFDASLDLAGLEAEAFGLSQPQVTTETAHQDDPNDVASASVKKSFTLDHAARATITTALSDDLDLYIVYDAEQRRHVHDRPRSSPRRPAGPATSASPWSTPGDGNYQAWVHGLRRDRDAHLPAHDRRHPGHRPDRERRPRRRRSPAGTAVTLHVAFSKAMTAGQDYFGELQLGPTDRAERAVGPDHIHRN